MQTFLIKTSNGFEPAPGFESDIEKIPSGANVKAIITRPRNIAFHRKFFAMINLGFENQEVFKTQDAFRSRILIDSGHYEFGEDYEGGPMIRGKSMKFTKMDQTEFESVYEDVFTTMLDFICAGKNTAEERELFEQELLKFI